MCRVGGLSLFPQLNLSGNVTKDTAQVYSYGDSKSLPQNLSKKINPRLENVPFSP